MAAETNPRAIPDPATEPTITPKRVAAILGIGTRNTYDAIDRGDIPSIRIGRRIVIPTAKFLAKFDLAPTDNPNSKEQP